MFSLRDPCSSQVPLTLLMTKIIPVSQNGIRLTTRYPFHPSVTVAVLRSRSRRQEQAGEASNPTLAASDVAPPNWVWGGELLRSCRGHRSGPGEGWDPSVEPPLWSPSTRNRVPMDDSQRPPPSFQLLLCAKSTNGHQTSFVASP